MSETQSDVQKGRDLFVDCLICFKPLQIKKNVHKRAGFTLQEEKEQQADLSVGLQSTPSGRLSHHIHTIDLYIDPENGSPNA